MNLLERESQLNLLQGLLVAARDGAGSIVLVGGEAGIGKTSLVSALCERRGTMNLWWGACDALQTPHPLAPLHDIARTNAVGFGADIDALGRLPLFGAVLSELQASPTMFVVEDAHWADEATLDLLRFLGRRLLMARGLGACVGVGPRHDEKDKGRRGESEHVPEPGVGLAEQSAVDVRHQLQ